MALAIFDLDNTLLAGDSDYLWGEFVIEKGLVDPEEHRRLNARFYEDYRRGELDIRAYQAFALKALKNVSPKTLAQWHDAFMRDYIEPIILPEGQALIERHRKAGDTVMIITATNTFVTRPIAARLGVDVLLGTEPEVDERGRYTGNIVGTPTFQRGKVIRLNQWLEKHGETLEGSWFYSDSHNDLPLLEKVDRPVAVDPDDILRRHAQEHGWPIISLRQPSEAKTERGRSG